jgi:hypothetical protein
MVMMILSRDAGARRALVRDGTKSGVSFAFLQFLPEKLGNFWHPATQMWARVSQLRTMND